MTTNEISDLKLPLILLVDDDPNDEELARIALEETRIPHQLVVRRDGVEAWAWIQENIIRAKLRRPQLILLDLKLPKMTGLELLEKLRSDTLTKALPVVIFTSSLEEKDLLQSYQHGANAYIRKPIDFTEYRRTIADTTRFWIELNQSPWT